MKQVVTNDYLGSNFYLENSKLEVKLPIINSNIISYIPTNIGNTVNLNEFVTDTNGNVWFIDYKGNAFSVKPKSKTVNYKNHFLKGAKTTNYLGWDYRNFTFDCDTDLLYVIFSDDNSSYSTTVGAGNLDDLIGKILDVYNNSWAGNSTVIEIIKDGNFFYIKTSNPQNNLQITIRNDTTGIWGDGTLDYESDGIDGRKPYNFDVVEVEEYIRVTDATYDVTDKALVKKQSSTVSTYTGNVIGWSEPEGVQWSNVPLFDTRVWDIRTNIETDGLGYVSYPSIVGSYNTFSELIDTLNSQLISYGSSFRLIGTTDNRIFLTDLAGNLIIGSTDPYFTNHNFNVLELNIIDNVTGSDFLIKGANPKDFSVTNVLFTTSETILSFVNLPQSNSVNIPVPLFDFPPTGEPITNNNFPVVNGNKVLINIRYPEGYSDFEQLVQAGKIRCQMQHLDSECYVINRDITGTITKRARMSNRWKWCKHNNGKDDKFDYLFGGQEKDNSGTVYPDKIGMIMLPNSLKPNQETIFEIIPDIWYGKGGVGNCGVVSSLFPMTLNDYLTSSYSTLRGSSNKEEVGNNPIIPYKKSKNDRKYFRFCFMFKNANRRWEQGAFSEPFYIDIKLNKVDIGAGLDTHAVGFRRRRA